MENLKIFEKCKLVFYTGIPHAGTSFLFSVLNRNPNICTMMLNDEFFKFLSNLEGDNGRIQGIQCYYKLVKEISSNIDRLFYSKDIILKIENVSHYLCKNNNYNKYLNALFLSKEKLTIREIIISIFQAKMICEKGKVNSFETPVFVFDAHSRVDAFIKHRKIIELFDDYVFYSSYRNPLYMTASSIKSNYYVNKEVTYRLLKMNTLSFLQEIPDEWKDKYYISRFEDEKLYPEETFKSICKTFGVEYSPDMLLANEEGPTCRGYAIRGFDTEPVTRKLDDIFSENDMKYLSSVFGMLMVKYHYINEEKSVINIELNELFCKSEEFLNTISRKDLVDVFEQLREELNVGCKWFYPTLIEKGE